MSNRPTRRWAAWLRSSSRPQHEGRHRGAARESSPATTTAREQGLVLIATTLDKGNGIGYYTAVLFDPATQEVILQMDMAGKPGGFGLRNYWAGSVYNASRSRVIPDQVGGTRTDTPARLRAGCVVIIGKERPERGHDPHRRNPVRRRIKRPEADYPAAPERASGHLGRRIFHARIVEHQYPIVPCRRSGAKVIVALASGGEF